MAEKVNRASFSLEDEYVELLKEIAWRERRNMTEQLRAMIDERALRMGLEPINPVIPLSPKASASILEMAPYAR